MKVLIVGGGGREHALAWKISRSPLVEETIVAPGNAGTAAEARCEPVSAEDVDRQVALALREKVGLVVIGPEAALVAGLADRLAEAGVPVFGPTAAAARLEGSKIFAKEFMRRHGIPTADFSAHDTLESALAAVERRHGPCVVKADGLAAGKGVIVCRNPFEARGAVRDLLEERRYGEAGARVLIEDLLVGDEVSVLAICDGERILPFVPAQDHKAAYEGDTGPNTGGMGAYAPAPVLGDALREEVSDILERTVRGMASEGTPFRGILYAGLMICDGKPMVLEYNVRFGDPEIQPLVVMMKDDLVPVLAAAAAGDLRGASLAWHDGAALCVVLVAEGYPGRYEKDKPIEGLAEAAAMPDVTIFHAGTAHDGTRFVTSGGRVLGVTARGSDLTAAARAAYFAAGLIRWDGMRMRRDIGHRAL
ncbi:MAG: phosphoribosylamine--glycine ligase [Deltaproteobacteria bacterium]|nr:phosphoribosylamine--glycine ligase [Deltaproteobacteria bacterium]